MAPTGRKPTVEHKPTAEPGPSAEPGAAGEHGPSAEPGATGGQGPSAGQAVRRHRLTLGVSLRELARRLAVSPATVSAIENGRTGMSVQRLHQIAAALGVPATTFVEDPARSPDPWETVPQAGSNPAEAGPSAGVKGPASSLVTGGGTGNWREFGPLPIDSVLAGAIRAFVATGYHGASMRDIARQSSMSVPGVYHHYLSKQDLLSKILDLTMTDLIWRVESARDEGRDPLERIALVVEAMALFHTRRNDLAFIGASEMRSLEPANRRRIAAMRDHVQHLLDGVIDAAIAQGLLKIGADTRNAGKAIATMCTGLPSWFRLDGPTTPEQTARQYAQFALRLLGTST
ncbi:TetR family transcriptional regulator [Sphaerisporangium perillae]|uniref:TetR family transcriptional regulator n=1 Tax=Sphaerisporangium perillae TaxID=2935860 RepID=UPI00201077E0|nr:TetR family transcriptional regulator [Sphaerisporangium perillae]